MITILFVKISWKYKNLKIIKFLLTYININIKFNKKILMRLICINKFYMFILKSFL